MTLFRTNLLSGRRMNPKRTVVLAIAACVVKGACGSQPTPSSAILAISLASLHGTIVFTRSGGIYGDGTVFTANADGSREARVTPLGSTCCPRLSRDGNHILLAHQAPDGQRITIGIIDFDGSHERTLPLPDPTLNLGPGAWSPDGSRIAGEGWDDTKPGRNGVYTFRASDGGQLVRVTQGTGLTHDIPLDFSPDGGQIVFQTPSNTDGHSPYGPLFVVNADGSGLHQITPQGTVAASARWSPDGRWILFAGPYCCERAGPIWVIHPDGSGLRKVFADPAGRAAVTPTWSPDGSMILFGLAAITGHEHEPDIVSVARSDGSGLNTIATSNDVSRDFEWVGSS